MALTDKQQKFVEEYVKNPNATQAAIKAGYSAATAASEGHKLKKKPEIAKAIEARFTESAMSAGEVLGLLGKQARSEYTVAQYITVGTDSKPAVNVARMLADGNGHLIKSIKYTRYGVNVEFHDPMEAKKLIFNGHGLNKSNTLDEPQHNVQWTVEEWKAEKEKRTKQAAETMADFEDDGDE